MGLHLAAIMTAAAIAVGTPTETTKGTYAPNVLTTMTDPNSWRLDSPRLALSKNGTTHGQMINETAETTGVSVTTIIETVETIDVTLAVTATK